MFNNLVCYKFKIVFYYLSVHFIINIIYSISFNIR
nr:MAG TPA: hypothetical protein [Caudoviricetes sp.]